MESLHKAILSTISDSDLAGLGIDIADSSVDDIVLDGVLGSLPVIKTVRALWTTGVSVRDALFVHKLATFLEGIEDAEPARRREVLRELQAASSAEYVGQRLVTAIDRIESSEKARLLARAFGLLAEDKIDSDDFWRVTHCIETLGLTDLRGVVTWRTVPLNRVDKLSQQVYTSVGLGWFVLDFSSTGFEWNESLCMIMEEVLRFTHEPNHADE